MGTSGRAPYSQQRPSRLSAEDKAAVRARANTGCDTHALRRDLSHVFNFPEGDVIPGDARIHRHVNMVRHVAALAMEVEGSWPG